MNNFKNNHRRNRFRPNSDRNFKKRNGNGHKLNGDFNNNSEFKKKGEKPIRIDWRIFGIKDKYKLFDIIVEGVSLVQTNRSQFSSVVRRNDGSISALLKLLRKKNSK